MFRCIFTILLTLVFAASGCADFNAAGVVKKKDDDGDDPQPPPDAPVDEPALINLTAHCSSDTAATYLPEEPTDETLVACVVKDGKGAVVEGSDYEVTLTVGGASAKAALVAKKQASFPWQLAVLVKTVDVEKLEAVYVVMTTKDGSRGYVKSGKVDFDWRSDPLFGTPGEPPAAALKVTRLPDGGGQAHQCAVMSDGTARCWGFNLDGRLGDGSKTNRNLPVTVVKNDGVPLKSITALSLGQKSTCAVAASRVHCAGDGEVVRVGGAAARQTMAEIPGLGDATQVSVGLRHACALLKTGEVQCWGWNGFGQIGDGTKTVPGAPVHVLDVGGSGRLGNVVQISAGTAMTCALRANGQMLCWGGNDYGSIGDGTTVDRLTPVEVSGLGEGSGVTQIAAGRAAGNTTASPSYPSATCARKSDGTAVCWGHNVYGQLGDGTKTQRAAPAKVQRDDDGNGTPDGDLTGVETIVAGPLYTCATLTDGTARCWGYNAEGQLGDATKTGPKLLPVRVQTSAGNDLRGVRELCLSLANWSDATFPTTLGRLEDGTARAWGENNRGQLGNGTTTDSHVPEIVKLP